MYLDVLGVFRCQEYILVCVDNFRYFRSSDETRVVWTYVDDSKEFPSILLEAFARPA